MDLDMDKLVFAAKIGKALTEYADSIFPGEWDFKVKDKCFMLSSKYNSSHTEHVIWKDVQILIPYKNPTHVRVNGKTLSDVQKSDLKRWINIAIREARF